MIQIQNLTKSYGDIVAIDRLNFSVAKGEVVGFLGPNGAGKSTTMKIITGFMAPSDGLVQVAGFDVFDNPIEVKKRIGYLPETPPVYLDMFVNDYLNYVAKLKGVSKDKVSQYVDQAIDKTNLGDVKTRLIGNLSKGYRQRVGLAQALVSNPEVLILDEPTVGLDPKQVAEIRSLIKALAGEHTIVLSTHILPEVQASCERIIIINRGRIVAEDTMDGLNRRMQGGRRILLRVARGSDSFTTGLRALRGVAGVLANPVLNTSAMSNFSVQSASAEGARYEVDIANDDSVLESVAEFCVSSKAGLREIRSIDMSLEDIFLKVTSQEGTSGKVTSQEGAGGKVTSQEGTGGKVTLQEGTSGKAAQNTVGGVQ